MNEPPPGAEDLQAGLERLLPGITVEWVGQTGSTNADLLERARAGAQAGPCLRVAERQTAGRGRLGRTWRSTPGASLTFSLAVELASMDLSGLSLAVGVALADALDPLRRTAPPRLGLKWPNDLWLVDAGGGRKLGGVLIETLPVRGSGRMVVIGVGLNVAPIDDSAGEFASGCACWQEVEPGIGVATVLGRVAPALVTALGRFERAGFGAFTAGHAARDLLHGRAVQWGTGAASAAGGEGVGAGVTPEGGLRLLQADGSIVTVSSGEVSVRLGAALPAWSC